MSVSPGDIVMGDLDGVVVIPQECAAGPPEVGVCTVCVYDIVCVNSNRDRVEHQGHAWDGTRASTHMGALLLAPSANTTAGSERTFITCQQWKA